MPDPRQTRLKGRFVIVHNGGAYFETLAQESRVFPLGDAPANAAGDFIFAPGRGGERLDKLTLPDPELLRRYRQAAHFGEVNTYYHLNRIATYLDTLLAELQADPLPRVTAIVNAHHAAVTQNGIRDGILSRERWHPFQGGHYRLPNKKYDVPEFHPLKPNGEIHLGPGWQLLNHGALVMLKGKRYRNNASHNCGIIYHEYGHHLNRHTADFQANALRSRHNQSNRKSALDEGTADFWAAVLMNTPHIWACHRQHDALVVHPRSLVSPRTMSDYDHTPTADCHSNGTIWAATLWDLRQKMGEKEEQGGRNCDRLVLKMLLLLGQMVQTTKVLYPRSAYHHLRKALRHERESFATALSALFQADQILFGGKQRVLLEEIFYRRGIFMTKPFWEITEIQHILTNSSRF